MTDSMKFGPEWYVTYISQIKILNVRCAYMRNIFSFCLSLSFSTIAFMISNDLCIQVAQHVRGQL